MERNQLTDILKRAHIVPELTGLLRPQEELWLVGGALRDLFLGRPGADFDFAMPTDPTLLARDFAMRVGGHWFLLDAERRQSRVVYRLPKQEVTCDFAPFRAPGIEADLRLRDFTINAFAVRLLAQGEPGPLFDPLGAGDDLAAGRLRACSPGVFLDDHLRVLKGVRHAVTLSFTLEEETFSLMRQAAPLLPRVAPERVRAEMGSILAAGPMESGSDLLDRLCLLQLLFGPAGADGGLAEGKQAAKRMEEVLNLVREDQPALLLEEFEAGLNRAALLRLATFLHGWGSSPEHLVEALRLGRRATAVLRSLSSLSPARGEEAERLPDLPRARALWAASLGSGVPDSLLFLAMLQNEPGKAIRSFLPILRDFLRLAQNGRIPDLIDGSRIRELSGLTEGPEIGRLLATLREEEISGLIRTPEEAVKFLREGKKSR